MTTTPSATSPVCPWCDGRLGTIVPEYGTCLAAQCIRSEEADRRGDVP